MKMAQLLSFWLVPQIFCSVKSFRGKKKLNNKIISKQLCPAILLITCMASGRKNKRWPACSQSCYRLRNRKRWTEITLKRADKEDPQDGDFWQQEEVLIFTDVPLQNRQKALAADMNRFPPRRHLGQLSLIHVSKLRKPSTTVIEDCGRLRHPSADQMYRFVRLIG